MIRPLIYPGEENLRLSTGNGLQLSDSALLAVLSELAYADDEEVSAAVPQLNLDLVMCFDRVYTQGFIAATDQELILDLPSGIRALGHVLVKYISNISHV